MIVNSITILKCNTPFEIGFHSPQRARRQAESMIVILQFNNGIAGYGESAPRAYVTGESPYTVAHIIKNHFSKILFDTEISSVSDIEDTLHFLEEECWNANIKAYNSALGAIDIALLDALGKFQKTTIDKFLYPIIQNNLPRSLSIPLLPPAKIRDFCDPLKSLELESFKILMSEGENDNIERVQLIRSLFGDNVKIRIEANGKWSRDQAISTIEKLKKFNISGVEQPVAGNDIEGLRKIRNITGIPVIVDESLITLADAKHLIENEACDIINIKISKCGGIIKCKQIADLARSRNILCQVGSHVGETDILNKAGEYFAMTVSNLFSFEGFSSLLFGNIWQRNDISDQLLEQIYTIIP